jgi:hypothetical protein
VGCSLRNGSTRCSGGRGAQYLERELNEAAGMGVREDEGAQGGMQQGFEVTFAWTWSSMLCQYLTMTTADGRMRVSIPPVPLAGRKLISRNDSSGSSSRR